VPADATEARIYVSNHVSWFDILALVEALAGSASSPRRRLFRVPLFGPAARAVGTVPIERANRKSAFESYRVAES
jgi:1-acyl-sn-glycerol-3-phosphate acyltransferase